ncbi:MAG: IS3 family transposase [Proteobacteria bacterium]|nr:IS3 family transposase [Pseudomonadota bacterium]
MESFWGTLKNELVYHHTYETRQQAIQDITEYIEIFYNRQRRQKRLGYLSPAAYEKNTTKGCSQRERFGLHYCRPTSVIHSEHHPLHLLLLFAVSTCRED